MNIEETETAAGPAGQENQPVNSTAGNTAQQQSPTAPATPPSTPPQPMPTHGTHGTQPPPSPAPPPPRKRKNKTARNGAALLDDITQAIERHVVLPPFAAEALALWVLHTHAFKLREVATYVGIESPEKRCGKTTLLTLLAELVHSPEAAANISPSAFYRLIQEKQPTLIIDEADILLRRNDQVRGVLNAGYTRKTGFVVRVVHERSRTEGNVLMHILRDPYTITKRPPTTRTVRFSCWCPKIFAGIGRLPDTLADRCIVIRMQRKARSEKRERAHAFKDEELRGRCVNFVYFFEDAIRKANPATPEELNDRAADIWEPLFVLADLAGDRWPELARRAAVELSSHSNEPNASERLLLEVAGIFDRNGTDRVYSRDLVAGLKSGGDLEWAEPFGFRDATAAERITELWLAKELRAYGIRPKAMRIGGELGKGYLREEVREACERYVGREEGRVVSQ